MTIKFKTCLAGATFTRNAGDIVEVEDAEATRLIEAGFAEPVKKRGGRTATQATPDLETADEPK
jgi:hypothetical protein